MRVIVKVQHSESRVKKRFSTTSLTDKNTNQSYQSINDLKASKSAIKDRTTGHANCNSHILEYNNYTGLKKRTKKEVNLFPKWIE